MIAFIATSRPAEAVAFYRDALGLTFLEETEFSLVFTSGDTMLRVQKLHEVRPRPDTTLGWEVDSIADRIQELSARGIEFEWFEGLPAESGPIWVAPDGTQVVWFRDPDGNLLSITQFVEQ